MDPVIEGDLWTTFHSQLAAEIARQLAPKLAPRYVALTEKRYVLEFPEDFQIAIESRYPDVGILQAQTKARRQRGAGLRAAPLEMATVMVEKVPHFWVEIRDARNRRLVTLIEILSPTNKRGQGRQEYLEKRAKLLGSSAHLLEIDLVRQGRRLPMRQPLPDVPYFVFLSRVGRRPIIEVWPIGFDQPLPPIPIPLLNGDPDVTLILQKAITQVYEICRYDLILDYTVSPEVPLPKAAARWLKRMLKRAE
jgi:hypothetical protein